MSLRAPTHQLPHSTYQAKDDLRISPRLLLQCEWIERSRIKRHVVIHHSTHVALNQIKVGEIKAIQQRLAKLRRAIVRHAHTPRSVRTEDIHQCVVHVVTVHAVTAHHAVVIVDVVAVVIVVGRGKGKIGHARKWAKRERRI